MQTAKLNCKIKTFRILSYSNCLNLQGYLTFWQIKIKCKKAIITGLALNELFLYSFSAFKMSDNEDFEEQLRLEEEERKFKNKTVDIEDGRIRTDSDGTIYEWNAEKQAWFPKVILFF